MTTAFKFALALLFVAPVTSTSASAAGGEDFPFFCHIAGNGVREAFQVKSDLTSTTGYALNYYENGRLIQRTPVWIDQTLDQKHFRLRARFPAGVLFDKHIIAFIGKSEQDYSSADTKKTLRGRAPQYQYRPLHCR